MLCFIAVIPVLGKRPLLVRSWTGDFRIVQDELEMLTNLLYIIVHERGLRKVRLQPSIMGQVWLIIQPFVFLPCCMRMKTFFAPVSHAHSTDLMVWYDTV
jgi:hypothetical protein